VIRISDVTKAFGTGEAEVRAVDRANLTIADRDFVMILGRSGSGKSTLLGMISGLIRPTSGSVVLKGEEIGALTDDRISALRAQEIGFVFQFSGLIPTLTALENVMLPTLFCNRNGDDCRERALELLRKVGMSERAAAYPSTLSSGEMKRVAIARALINNPALLIADEPTGDLDVATELEIMELFGQLNREGMTIVMVTHNPDLEPYASRTCRMAGGKISASPASSSAGTGHGQKPAPGKGNRP
jgi:putative ABC transport system ATP-binding protein